MTLCDILRVPGPVVTGGRPLTLPLARGCGGRGHIVTVRDVIAQVVNTNNTDSQWCAVRLKYRYT